MDVRNSFVDQNPDFVYESLRRFHTALFDHPDFPAIYPTESAFLYAQKNPGDRNGLPPLTINPAANDAERIYKKAGVKRAANVQLPADLITSELEFMAYLHNEIARSIQNNDQQRKDDLIAILDEFNHYHCSKWFAAFFEACASQDKSFYQTMGAVGTIFIQKLQ